MLPRFNSDGSIFRTISFFQKFNKNKFTEFNYKTIKAVHNYSVNIKEENFTNFLSHNGGDVEQKNALKDIKEQINKNEFIESKFESIELNENKKETDRIIRIINSYGNIKVSSIKEIYKCKYKKEKRVQVYLYPKNEEISIVLFDVHHLGLSGDLNSKVKANGCKVYNKHKNKLFDIKQILT